MKDPILWGFDPHGRANAVASAVDQNQRPQAAGLSEPLQAQCSLTDQAFGLRQPAYWRARAVTK
jgi:hypothetical protein